MSPASQRRLRLSFSDHEHDLRAGPQPRPGDRDKGYQSCVLNGGLQGAGDNVGLGLLDIRPDLLRLLDEILGPLLLPHRREDEIDHAGSEAGRQMSSFEVGAERLRDFVVERLAEVERNQRRHGLRADLVLGGRNSADHAAFAFVRRLDDASVSSGGVGLDIVDASLIHLIGDLVPLGRVLERAREGRRERRARIHRSDCGFERINVRVQRREAHAADIADLPRLRHLGREHA